MKKHLIIILLSLLMTGFLKDLAAQKFIDSFDFKANPYEMNRTANPTQYFGKSAPKAAVMGLENGSFEAWIWPWKVLRQFEFSFFLENSTQPVKSAEIVRKISVTPEVTRFYYSYESFSVVASLFIPPLEQGIIILLDVTTTKPLRIVPGFIPVMQPQWPAGAGGQYSYWDNNLKGFIISASAQNATFICGSPAGEEMSNPPAHMLSDNPLQFSIPVKPGETKGKYIPLVITGLTGMPADSLEARYRNLCTNSKNFYNQCYTYYQDLLANTIEITTPDQLLNKAFVYGKVNLRNLLVNNSNLGTGLVAGYGLSGTGGRPGFAWFFGGDAFINSLALSNYGDYNTVKEALVFTQKWQRKESFPITRPDQKGNDIGKMAHELSQSHGLVDWWNNYHFGYNHADTSPWYLVAIAEYFRKTGDMEFLNKSWPSIMDAYKWCLDKDSNDDGLMDLKGAGLGVLEFGKLVNMHNDNYTQGIWTRALENMIFLADKMNEKSVKREAENLLEKARNSMEDIYWMEDKGYYSFAANEKNEKVIDKTCNTACSLMLGVHDPARAASTIKSFNESDLNTDWGYRIISNKSTLYNPLNYNYGAVWSFSSTFVGAAQFRYHFNLSAYATLVRTANHLFEYGLGASPEVFSGDLNTKLAEAYHDQGFSVTGFMVPFTTGLAGLDVNAAEDKISFRPQIPANWDFLTVKNIRIKNSRVDLYFTRTAKGTELKIQKTGAQDVNLEFAPVLAPGTRLVSATIDGNVTETSDQVSDRSSVFQVSTAIGENTLITFETEAVPDFYWTSLIAEPGAANSGLKVISQEFKNNLINLQVEGLSGKTYELGVVNKERIKSVVGGKIDGNLLKISLPDKEKGKFIKQEIVVILKD